MQILNVVPDFLVAVLAVWLGASVLSRAPREYAPRVFGLLTLLAGVWGASRVVFRLSEDAAVRATFDAVTAGVATLLPAALLHLVLASTRGRRGWSRSQTALLAAAYAVGAFIGFLSVTDRARAIAIGEPNRGLLGAPGWAVGWGWVLFRSAILGLAIWWAWRAWREEEPGGSRRGQLGATLAAVACGSAGGIATILGRQLAGTEWEWPGTLLVALGLALASYGVFAQRVFLAPGVAQKSALVSVAAGLVTAAYALLLSGGERLARRALEIDASLVTAVALVLSLALFDPMRERLRALLDRRSEHKEVAYRRLLRALGGELLFAQKPEEAVGPALQRLCRTLGVREAAVLGTDGRVIASVGRPPAPDASFALELPVRAGERSYGRAVFGPKRNRLPYSPEEEDLLRDAVAFVGASLQLAEKQAGQAEALETLSRERAALRDRESALAESLHAAETARVDGGPLKVYALGPLRVERDGEAIRSWGGAKAGTRQAEALFAFLLDRGERGVAKDELTEVIWPDVPPDKADLAFHRTLGGLRKTLEPELKRGRESTAVVYHNDRYRLDPALVGWSDVALFEEKVASAAGADPEEAMRSLEEARELYRGEYLDDCPFYGDSLYVEDRRSLLRGRYIDLLLALGERYERGGDGSTAAARYREALQVASDDCPRADDGLARLGLPL